MKTSIVILPHSTEATVALGKVRQFLESHRAYLIFIKVNGKISDKGVVTLNYIDSTTDINKAITGNGYYTPQDWLNIANARNLPSTRLKQNEVSTNFATTGVTV